MELGLHRRDVHLHLLRDEAQRTEISALLWSIVILDRGWSAVTGLPQNFQESDFDQSMEPPVSDPFINSRKIFESAPKSVQLLTLCFVGERLVSAGDDLVHIHEPEIRSPHLQCCRRRHL